MKKNIPSLYKTLWETKGPLNKSKPSSRESQRRKKERQCTDNLYGKIERSRKILNERILKYKKETTGRDKSAETIKKRIEKEKVTQKNRIEL